jgi:two-component system, LuxR family, sensor kinase FixL
MSWVTVIYSMTASACLTLALIYGFIWWRQRDAWVNLLFASAAVATAVICWFDLAILRASSPAEIASAIRWIHLPVWLLVLSLAGFVRLFLDAGRSWLLWTVCGLRTAAVILNFLTGENINYREISSLRHLTFLGESVSSIGEGVPNPWFIVAQLAGWALLIFVVDASITAWRRGDRRKAVFVGGSIVFFSVTASVQTALIVWGHFDWVPTTSLFNLGILVTMGYEFGGEALRATQMSRDLTASQQRITLAAEAAKLGFWSRKSGQDELWATDQWRALLGFAKSDRLDYEAFLQRLHPDDRDSVHHALTDASRGDGRYRAEHRVLLPDGQMRWISSQGRVEFDGHSQPIRFQGVSLDITHSKQAEIEAQEHRNEVAHLMRVASVGELSAALAHELNQPLTAILSNAQAAQLLLARDDVDLEDIRDILRDIVTDDQRAGEVISRLRHLLKKSEFQPQELNANELIGEVLKLMKHELTARGVRVVTELNDDMPSIVGDRVQLQQVLINLILNANDAMSREAESARTLTLSSNRVENRSVQISVTDTGSGIPPGEEEKVFEPYRTTKAQGLGLGLSLSRSIIRAHGGRLWAANRAVGGATFHFTIPEWESRAR